MSDAAPFPDNAWLTYREATQRWGLQMRKDQAEYICKDASDAAIAAARAEGVREVVISRIQDLISWLESDADNIHFLPADEVAILRDWLNGKPAAEAQP